MKNATRAKAERDPRDAAPRPKLRTDATAKNDGARDPAVRPRGAALRKLDPKSKLPIPSVLKRIDPADVEVLAKILGEPMECVYNPEFPKVNAERLFCGPLEDEDDGLHPVIGGDPFVPAASSTKALTADDEQRLFMCLNYCRYRAMRVVRNSGPGRLTGRMARELVRWSRAALTIRTRIVEANLSLVPAMAKRSRNSSADIADLICEGNLALVRSVDKFDCSRGFKFSTYACRAILSSFSSSSAKSSRYRAYFPTEYDPALEKSDYLERRREDVEGDCLSGLRSVLDANTAGLSQVEQRVLEARFNLDHPQSSPTPARSKTLKQVAELIGVTKERVRQIQNKALTKLRSVMEADVLAA